VYSRIERCAVPKPHLAGSPRCASEHVGGLPEAGPERV